MIGGTDISGVVLADYFECRSNIIFGYLHQNGDLKSLDHVLYWNALVLISGVSPPDVPLTRKR